MFTTDGFGYFLEQSTRPQRCASPVKLAPVASRSVHALDVADACARLAASRRDDACAHRAHPGTRATTYCESCPGVTTHPMYHSAPHALLPVTPAAA
jgi:hypothetical protein